MGYDRASYQKNKADALFRVGFHAEVTGKTEEAIKSYEKAIAASPSHYQSYVQLSRIYERMGLPQKAAYYKEESLKSRIKTSDSPERKPTIKRISYERSASPSSVSRSLDPIGSEEGDPEGDEKIMEMLPRTWDAFFGKFDSLREVQRKTVPIILQRKNAIVVSSTASGKTEAVFAPLIERLLAEDWKGLSIIYISPTRALVSDIKGRLESILSPLGVRVTARSGDAKDFDDADPQQVMVTTPESLDSFLSWKGEHLKGIKAVVLDELHMIDGSYRGDQLRILVRRMELEYGLVFNTYAISATVSDPKALASRYMKDARIIRIRGGRGIDYRILPNLDQAIRTINDKGYRKGLVFCNTPQEAEEVASRSLRRHFSASEIRVHHGKLQTPMRVEAERALRDEEKIMCACTSTLEVGIDIGDVDLIALASRPLSVSSVAQRIGRGNRKKDRITVLAVAKTVGESIYYEKVFEAILKSKFDTERYRFDPSVVVQQILSSLSSSSKEDEFFSTIFAGIFDLKEVGEVLRYLEKRGYIDKEGGKWQATDKVKEFGSKIFSNIPSYESIKVIDQRTEEAIGRIELPIDNIFVLGGQAWMVRERTSDCVLVTPVDSATEIPNFASYDRFGAFFDLLPQDIRIRCRKEIKHSASEDEATKEEVMLTA